MGACTDMSVKKTLGTIGALVFFGISGYAVFREPTQVGNVLWPLGIMISALFGIKTFGGIMMKNNKKE